MEFLVNAEQMKKLDIDTIRQIGIPDIVLMERAALAVVEELKNARCDLRSVLVVCGSGNNGGDGFAVARLLSEKGIHVTTAFVGKESSMTPLTFTQKKICENCGMKISSNFMEGEYTTIVDAIFGIGLSRCVEGRYADVIRWINSSGAVKAAVDIPSGISADTGKVQGTAVKADFTVTFACRKIGQILYPGTEYCGQVICRDIGIRTMQTGSRHSVFALEPSDLHQIRRRSPYSNKGTYGRVLLIAGSNGMSGAACLAAKAAYRSGCGLVRVFTPECNRQVVQTYLPEAIVTSYDPEVFPEEELKKALDWSDVTGIGPGLGTGKTAGRILEYILKKTSEKTVVIDADGLNLLASDMELLNKAECPVILTPHVGEMARLTGMKTGEVVSDLLKTARDLAKKYSVVCVLKDARTVISDGSCTYINTTGNSGMAVGGSGDVLTGIICGLIAQGMHDAEGACTGVLLHGMAGDEAEKKHSGYSMMAGDIADGIGAVLMKADIRNTSGIPE